MSQPSLLLVAGTDEHRRRMFTQATITKFQAKGYSIFPVDAEDHDSITNLIATTGVLFSGNTLAVIANADKLLLEDVSSHMLDPNPALTLLLVSESAQPKGEVVSQVPKAQTRIFTLPAFYKMESFAAEYAVEVAKQHGMTLSPEIAKALVQKVGSDLGVIFYEVGKVVQLAKVLGINVIEPIHVKEAMAPLMELDGSALVAALGTRRIALVASELQRYYQSKRGDPTIEVCGKVLSPNIIKWLQAAHMHEKGLPAGAAASRVGANPWYWEHNILPQARAWGVTGCKQLLHVIARSQVAVFEGALKPWGILETGILRAIRVSS